MKQIIRYGLLFNVFALLISCTASTIVIKSTEVTYLFPELKNQSPTMSLSFELLGARNAALQTLFKNTLYKGETPEVYMANLKSDWNTQYNGLQKEVSVEMITGGEPYASCNWEYIEIFNALVFPQKIVIARSRDSYTGGAHPNHEKKYYVLDTNAMKQVLLDDIILETSHNALQSMIEDALRKNFKLADGAPLKSGGLFEDNVELTENFFLTKEGLGFAWNQYEIAPYALGQIEVVLPRENVLPFLTEKGKTLLPIQ